MTAKDSLEERLENLGRAISSDESLVENVMRRIESAPVSRTDVSRNQLLVKRLIMNRLTKIAAAAVIVIVAVVSITFLGKSMPTAYAIEQTVEALKNVRFLHLVRRDESGQIEDERWIEIGLHGRQVRYRQDTPPNFLVIEDGKDTAVYHKDKNTVVLYDRNEKQYQWIGDLGGFLENLRQEGKIIEENADYQGQPAHRVLWPMMNAECYVDPETKLPIAIGAKELSYEQPPAGIFEITIPEGFAVVDKRPGASAPAEPDWLNEQQVADKYFREARYALAAGEYEEPVELFEYVVEKQPGRNWAWFWLGKSYYEQGKYDLAINSFSKVCGMMGGPPYCLYARGLAYAAAGMQVTAKEDLGKALPWMIRALREPTAASMFEYADDPRLRDGGNSPTEEQILARMVNRLRIVTGQNFGYDPELSAEENEQAISAWEEWFEESAEIQFTPDAELVIVPADPTLSDLLSNDPLLAGGMSQAESDAIEEFKEIREKIRAGEKFEDNSTPLHAYLTLLSAFHNRDLEAFERNCALDLQKMGMALTPGLLDKFAYFASLDVLRAPLPPGNPAQGELYPIYVSTQSENELADILLPVFWNGKWLWIGDMGRPADWRSAVPRFKDLLEKAGK